MEDNCDPECLQTEREMLKRKSLSHTVNKHAICVLTQVVLGLLRRSAFSPPGPCGSDFPDVSGGCHDRRATYTKSLSSSGCRSSETFTQDESWERVKEMEQFIRIHTSTCQAFTTCGPHGPDHVLHSVHQGEDSQGQRCSFNTRSFLGAGGRDNQA